MADSPPRPGMIARLERGVRGFPPGAFAMVMATGILAIACHLLGQPLLAGGLFDLNVLAYAYLVAVAILRLLLYPGRMRSDLLAPERGYSLLTAVAATNVLGLQLVVQQGAVLPAAVLGSIAALLWLVLGYAFILTLMLGKTKPTMSQTHGGWLMAVVATQSVAGLAATLAPHLGSGRDALLFAATALFLLGCVFYGLLIPWILQSLVFFEASPERLSPLNWVDMGACAITALSGSALIERAPLWGTLGELRPFVTGLVLVFWTIASWWIVPLVVLGIWRHLLRRYPVRYGVEYWGLVFPLGMYTVSTWQFARVAHLPMLAPLPPVFLWVTLVAWSVTYLGLVGHARRWLAHSKEAT